MKLPNLKQKPPARLPAAPEKDKRLKECQRILKQIDLELKYNKFTVEMYTIYTRQLNDRFKIMQAIPAEQQHLVKLKERLNVLIAQAKEKKLI